MWNEVLAESVLLSSSSSFARDPPSIPPPIPAASFCIRIHRSARTRFIRVIKTEVFPFASLLLKHPHVASELLHVDVAAYRGKHNLRRGVSHFNAPCKMRGRASSSLALSEPPSFFLFHPKSYYKLSLRVIFSNTFDNL